jgi:hypothetical protein
MATKLPTGVNESDLVADPSGRPGHYFDTRTKNVYNLGPGYDLPGAAKNNRKPGTAAPVVEETYIGKRVAILAGEFNGSHGTISDSDKNEDGSVGALVVVDGIGKEMPFDRFDGSLRFLTADEIAADEKALEEGENPLTK